MNQIRTLLTNTLSRKPSIILAIVFIVITLMLAALIGTIESELSDIRVEQRKLRITIDKIERMHLPYQAIE